MDTFSLLCVTALSCEQLEVIEEAFAIAQERDPKLQLTISDADAPSELFTSSDLLVCVANDTVAAAAIDRAQALGLPVLAVEGPVTAELIESGRSGFLVPAGSQPLADAIRWLARRAPVRERLRTGGLLAAGARLALPA